MYKCRECFRYIHDEDVEDKETCPSCGSQRAFTKACDKDHPCFCANEIHDTIVYCPSCGDAMCPECGSHDVVQISRVTGYLQEVSGWNVGKQQELKDRTRYTLT